MMTRRLKKNQESAQGHEAQSLVSCRPEVFQTEFFRYQGFTELFRVALAEVREGRWPCASLHHIHLCTDLINSILIVKTLWGREKELLLLRLAKGIH